MKQELGFCKREDITSKLWPGDKKSMKRKLVALRKNEHGSLLHSVVVRGCGREAGMGHERVQR